MAFPGTFRFPELLSTPSVPPSGYALIYMKTDNVLYILDSGGVETPLGSSSSITQLTGDVSATGPGVVSATVNFVDGYTAIQIGTAVQAYIDATSSNTPSVLVKRDASGNFSAGTITANLNGNATTATTSTTSTNFTGSLVGDVTGTQGATVVSLVGGSTASNVNLATIAANAATAANTASTIVKRDASGNFSANIITASLSGNATTSTTSTNFTGSLSGDVSGTQTTTQVDFVGGSTAANINSAEIAANAATALNTASTIVKRNASGNFSANIITASLNGNANNVIAGAITNNEVNAAAAIAYSKLNLIGSIVNADIAAAAAIAYSKLAVLTLGRALQSNSSTGFIEVSAVTNTELGYVSGVTSSIQAQINSITGSGITSLTGDVTGTGPGATATTVAFVGTSSAANVHLAELLANAATSANTFSAIVRRDASGNIFVTDINGIVPEAHASRHLPAGADPITTAAPLVNLDASTTNGVGTANSLARSDHSHAISTGIVSTLVPDQANAAGTSANLTRSDHIHNIPSGAVVQIGTSNFAGAAASFALSDHVHAHGNQTSTTLHALATTSLHGFMSSTDKTKLDASTSVNTPSTIVFRDGSGNFSAGTITASLNGNATTATSATTATTATNFTGSLSGDVAGTQSATVIQANVVSNSKLAQMPTLTIKGNNTGGTANALDLTVAQVNTMLGDVTTIGAFDGQAASANGLAISGNFLFAQSASSINPGMVNNAIQSFSGNKTFTGTVAISPSSLTALAINSTSFVFDSTNNALGIGAAPATNVFVDAINSTAASKTLQLTGYGTGSTVGTRGRFARGTSGTPAAAQSGDIINFWSARGYGTSQFAAASTAAINAVAGETFTNTSNLTYLTFLTTPTGSVTATENFRIASTGVTVGPQSTSTAIHQINGGMNVTTRTITANLTVDTTTSDYLIYCNNSGAINITLPVPTNGRVIIVKDIAGTANTNNITLVRNASEKIEGIAASRVLQTNWGSWTITSNGTDWWIL